MYMSYQLYNVLPSPVNLVFSVPRFAIATNMNGRTISEKAGILVDCLCLLFDWALFNPPQCFTLIEVPSKLSSL